MLSQPQFSFGPIEAQRSIASGGRRTFVGRNAATRSGRRLPPRTNSSKSEFHGRSVGPKEDINNLGGQWDPVGRKLVPMPRREKGAASSRPRHARGLLDALELQNRKDAVPARAATADAQGTIAADPFGRQDFLTPKAWNQLFRFRTGAQRSRSETRRTRLFPALSRRRLTRARCHHAKSPGSASAARRGNTR